MILGWWHIYNPAKLFHTKLSHWYAECQRLCIVAADADSNRSGMRRTEDDGDEVRGKEDKGGFLTGKRRLREEWGTRRSGRGRKQLRRDTCHQPPNIGTCQSSVTRWLCCCQIWWCCTTTRRWWYDELAGTCSQFQWTGYYHKKTDPCWSKLSKLKKLKTGAEVTAITLDLKKNVSCDVKEANQCDSMLYWGIE